MLFPLYMWKERVPLEPWHIFKKLPVDGGAFHIAHIVAALAPRTRITALFAALDPPGMRPRKQDRMSPAFLIRRWKHRMVRPDVLKLIEENSGVCMPLLLGFPSPSLRFCCHRLGAYSSQTHETHHHPGSQRVTIMSCSANTENRMPSHSAQKCHLSILKSDGRIF